MRDIKAGFAATFVLCALLYGPAIFGLPTLDLAAMLIALLTQELAAPGTIAWWLGGLLLMMFGTLVVPQAYTHAWAPIVERAISRSSWFAGLTWGFLLWLVVQSVVIPMTGLGYTSKAPQPVLTVLHGLLAHLAYGVVFVRMAETWIPRCSQHTPD
jgi:Na+/proline symporter